ncbi:TcdA/TcdB catalytic glycosyltransferase domain-containing protein [Serratia nevei]|uniref:TcdA/TcdB catalytic glycosyltransferase domain-containing protein n=1 Tax=Serratia marcescens TaxID=615 RepID=UPI0023F86781|nr:TcdA/TcdB catalytic glycosyltransferase domain-containing protein [Serratia marcescens]MDF8319139.1 TcdA/TcdB catalytic glycosyltransferase domain-containing protein [Serratia nevei]MDF8324745.1 TcdA/TcdB catalytic glycosyltransferase domain-containing protein [Serratia nevei]MDF8337797.1 TcdA/TcdB catalytic glycosyltransferase domain-containing protein [Serratia nevei]MDF8344604.1 TcdA/TcdB catalytic glycosyltransferase domain-containing protein [Serratia nevei]MDF8348827.1 TcdA/TcdB catal
MSHRILGVDLSKAEKISAPNILHFVWIGDLNELNTHYIEIWRETNKDKEVFFWHDRNASLCNLLNSSIRDFVNTKGIKDKEKSELKIKNSAFDYIYSKIKEGFSFDELVIEFLLNNEIPHQKQPKAIEESWFATRGLIKKNIAELFCNDFDDFMKYYYYEIILRCNLASASDIIRLLIIYQYGGVYIDVDTLPYTDNIYYNLSNYIKKEGVIENDMFFLFKTACFLNKINSRVTSSEYVGNYNAEALGVDVVRFEKIKTLIEIDIANFSLDMVLPLGNIYVYKNLLALGSLRRLKGIYFNNFISSHKKSKSVRMILRVMKKRYRFLEKNNCIFNYYVDDGFRCYLTRILTWRTELITKDYCVTSALTGPGLIVEVLLGLAYELFNVECSTEPSSIAEYMQDTEFGIALFQHNIDTPDGTHSTWRK